LTMTKNRMGPPYRWIGFYLPVERNDPKSTWAAKKAFGLKPEPTICW
jgi:hypothetical protein